MTLEKDESGENHLPTCPDWPGQRDSSVGGHPSCDARVVT